MPAPKKRKPRARRSSPAARPRLPKLEQRQLDLIGLGMVAAAVFFAFLIYLQWDGGEAGGWAVDGLRRLIGAVYYVVPAALLACGAILVLREMLPAVRPFRSGGLCLFGALTLGLAAGTLGLGPGGEAVRWDPDWVRPRGGLVGEGLYWGALDRARGGRRPHRGAVPVPDRRAAAHRRLGRRRGQGDDRLVHKVGVARARRGSAAARDRGAGRLGGRRAARIARDAAGRDRGLGGVRAGAVRTP